jgi:Rieske Fe-S protein
VLLTGGVVVAAAAVTAACGSSGSTSTPGTTAPVAPESPGATGSAPSSGGPTVSTSDVPVGGGVILAAARVVVTQPSAGEFKAFSAVCTHQGCTVAAVANGIITCSCHGSTFSAADGTPQGGPASSPLASVPVTVSGTTITLS